jgi:hypothetical protein
LRRLALVAATAIMLSACVGSTASSSPAASGSFDPGATSPVPTGTPSPSIEQTASSSPTPADTTPATPAETKFVLIKESVAKDGITTTMEYRATWSEPDGAASRFLVYGVTDCLRSSQDHDNMPCVIAGTDLPATTLKLIGTAPGTARAIDVSWILYDEAGPGPYQAVVLIAESNNGRSSPAVLWSALVCYGCVI